MAFAPAYLLSLEMENVRSFGPRQRLSLMTSDGRPARWTVILGNNGLGKTTVLEALALLLPEKRDMGSKFVGLSRIAQHFYTVGSGKVRPWTRNSVANSETQLDLSWTDALEKEPIVSRIVYREKYSSDPVLGRNWAGSSCTTFDFSKNTIAYGYGASRRQGEGALTDESSSDPMATLFGNSATLRNPEEWLLQTDYAAAKESPLQERAKKQLEQVKQILARVLPGIHDVRVSAREIPGKQVRAMAEVRTDDGWVSMSALGLGYRTMTAWMIDFASRLFERYPDLDDPLSGPAICLVDEIDLHLHPRWQRELIGMLTQLFPQTQFVATAHSPLIVQAATDANLVVLRREGDHSIIDHHSHSVRNWRLDQILTSELFDLPSARPPHLDALLRERDAILAKTDLTRADESRLAELRQAIGTMPIGETVEDLEAIELIRRAAAQLRKNQR